MTEPFEQLVLRYLDGQLGPEEESQLAELLRNDPKVRAFLRDVAEQAVVAADMERSEQRRQDKQEFAHAGPDKQRQTVDGAGSQRFRLVSSPWAVAAAAIVLLIVGIYQTLLTTQPEVATVTELRGALQWTGDGGQVVRNLEVGSSLPGGTLESLSADSWGKLRFLDGSTVTISGITVLTISEHGQKELHLTHGRLSASVIRQPADKPMLIHTPTAELRVLGTQFNLDAEPSATMLAVNEGLVCLKRLTDGREVEVPANHQAVASIDEQNGLTVTRRRAATSSWCSDLARDATHGIWSSELHALSVELKEAVAADELTEEEAKARYKAAANLSDETGVLFAAPWLVKHHKSGQKADLSCLVVLSVSRGQVAPVLLDAHSTFRIQGQVKSSTDVTFGLATNNPGSGFSGKYSAVRTIEVSPPDGNFDIEVLLLEFEPVAMKNGFTDSAIGKELAAWWCTTKDKGAGLAISHVELLPPAF